jgi:hypothetical protein
VTDGVAERDGAYVYLEPAPVSVFDDKVLDARLGAAGSALRSNRLSWRRQRARQGT